MYWVHKLTAWPEGITAWLLLLTLGAVVWQSSATSRAAEASETQAKSASEQVAFQKEVLRPRLKITNFKNDVFNEALNGKWISVQMEIFNSGGIPAYKVTAETWAEFVYGLPPYKFSPSAKYDKVDIENVHAAKPSGFNLPFNRGLSDQEKAAMLNGTGTICFRVRLTYRAFADEAHTDIGYSVEPQGMMHIQGYSSET
jgi:hypothetical protein